MANKANKLITTGKVVKKYIPNKPLLTPYQPKKELGRIKLTDLKSK